MGWLTGWAHAKDIDITGQAGAGTDYQVELEIGDSAGGDFHLEGNCDNFPQDIEITDNDGTTLLDFWIEDITADPIVMHVKVDDDLGSNQTIWMYYGKSGATTNSDIGATFIFGDDFVNADKWTLGYTDDINIATGKLRVLSASNEVAPSYVTSKPNFGTDFIFQFTYNRTSQNSGERTTKMGIASGTNPGTSTNSMFFQEYKNGSSYYRMNSIVDGTLYYTSIFFNPLWNELYNVKFTKAGASVNCKIWDTSHSEASPNLNENLAAKDSYEFPELTIALRYTGGDTGEFDDFRVRKYNDPEPAFASAGAEQNAPTGAIMNQFQKHNIGSDLYNGALST